MPKTKEALIASIEKNIADHESAKSLASSLELTYIQDGLDALYKELKQLKGL